jgi:hypothetical protein
MLKALSPLLELRQAILTAEDLADWLEPMRALFIERKVLIQARPATHVNCDACYDGHIEEVNQVGGGKQPRFYIACPEAGWVDVPESRLRQWSIDVNKLVALLADAVSGSQADVLVRGVAWKVGAIDIGDDSFDVVFFRPGEQPASDAWRQLSTRMVPARTVVISPGEIRERPDDLAALFTLDAAFELTEAGVAFQAKRVRSAITAQSTDVGNVFKLRGEFWQATFAGETKHFKDSVGMKYIARLLFEPHKDIPAVTLQSLQSGIDPLVMTGSSGELLDEQARQEYGQRFRELQEEFRKARENDDLAQIEALELEMEELTNAVTEATGLGGRSRQKTDIEKVRKSVREAISRDIRRIGKKHEALGNHLTTFIDTGLTCRYIPDPLVDWVT